MMMMKQRKQQQQQTTSPTTCPCTEEEEPKSSYFYKSLFRRTHAAASTRTTTMLTTANPVYAVTLALVMLIMVYARPGGGDLSRQVMELTTTMTSANSQQLLLPSLTEKNLTLSDFEITDYVGRGGINVVFLATVVNKQVAQQAVDHHRESLLWNDELDKPRNVVIKYIDTREYGHAEIESFERMLRIDRRKAQAEGLMQAIWAVRDIPNPYYCPLVKHKTDRWDDKKCMQEYNARPGLPQMSNTALARLRVLPTVDVIVLPHFEERYIAHTARTFQDVTIFFQSMLEQLMVAHEGGANNLDLQVDRNMFVERGTGRAIMFDWNGYLGVGAPTHDPHQSWRVAAPEAWLWTNKGINAINMNIHAMDIWQAGICWANFLYDPCSWTSASDLRDSRKTVHEKFWRSVVKTLGGNTMIPINSTHSVDAREYAGLSTSEEVKVPTPSEFKPLLKHCSPRAKSKISFMKDPSVPQEHKDLAVDLLIQMLRISPSDRPTARELLKHPFFRLFHDNDKAIKSQ